MLAVLAQSVQLQIPFLHLLSQGVNLCETDHEAQQMVLNHTVQRQHIRRKSVHLPLNVVRLEPILLQRGDLDLQATDLIHSRVQQHCQLLVLLLQRKYLLFILLVLVGVAGILADLGLHGGDGQAQRVPLGLPLRLLLLQTVHLKQILLITGLFGLQFDSVFLILLEGHAQPFQLLTQQQHSSVALTLLGKLVAERDDDGLHLTALQLIFLQLGLLRVELQTE